MAAPLCSTFLNATTAPDFPGDISAFVERPKEHHHPVVDAATPHLPTVAEFFGGISADETTVKDLSIIPPPLTEEENRVRVSELRTKDPYFDKMERMKAIMNRRKSRRSAVDGGETSRDNASLSSKSAADAPSTTSVEKHDDAVFSSANAAEIVSGCDQLIRKSALMSRTQTRVVAKVKWNEDGVSQSLCPARLERDIGDLERIVSRLENLVQNEFKIAIHLQKPPKPCLLLDPRFHEAASKALGERGLKVALKVVDAAERIEKFVQSTTVEDEATKEMLGRLTDHFEQEKNHLAYMMSVVKKAAAAAEEKE